jgi:hypothetical protein
MEYDEANDWYEYPLPGQPAGTILSVTVTVYDDDGNTATDSLIIEWVDQTPPVIGGITNDPEPPLYHWEPTEVRVTATDNVGVDHATIEWDGGDPIPMSYDEVNDWYEYPLPGQPAGTILSVTVTVYDEAGNNDTETYDIMWTKILATVNIDPNPLNFGSKGKWITAYIELPVGYEVNDIDASTVMLNDVIPASGEPTSLESGLMVKFDRSEVIEYILSLGITDGESIKITVTGDLINSVITFEGSDTIIVNTI